MMETSLHRDLKSHYAGRNARFEVPLGKYRIDVVHRATSREVFARGALRAAEFSAQAKPGRYTMLDVLADR